MCTAVVGGSIQRAATRISTAIDQRSATPMRKHRTKDRRELRSGVLGCVSEFPATFQNNRLGWIDIVPDKSSLGMWSNRLDRIFPQPRSYPHKTDSAFCSSGRTA